MRCSVQVCVKGCCSNLIDDGGVEQTANHAVNTLSHMLNGGTQAKLRFVNGERVEEEVSLGPGSQRDVLEMARQAILHH